MIAWEKPKKHNSRMTRSAIPLHRTQTPKAHPLFRFIENSVRNEQVLLMIVPDSHLFHGLSPSQWSEDLLDVYPR